MSKPRISIESEDRWVSMDLNSISDFWLQPLTKRINHKMIPIKWLRFHSWSNGTKSTKQTPFRNPEKYHNRSPQTISTTSQVTNLRKMTNPLERIPLPLKVTSLKRLATLQDSWREASWPSPTSTQVSLIIANTWPVLRMSSILIAWYRKQRKKKTSGTAKIPRWKKRPELITRGKVSIWTRMRRTVRARAATKTT